MKFEYSKIQIGDTVIVEDYKGIRTKMQVIGLRPGFSFPIVVGPLPEGAKKFRFGTDGSEQKVDHQAFNVRGYWFGDGTARIIKIKKPWKKFEGGVSTLRKKDKVRVVQDGKSYKGFVVDVRPSKAYHIQFVNEYPHFPNSSNRMHDCVWYHINGIFCWGDTDTSNRVIRELDIREYKSVGDTPT